LRIVVDSESVERIELFICFSALLSIQGVILRLCLTCSCSSIPQPMSIQVETSYQTPLCLVQPETSSHLDYRLDCLEPGELRPLPPCPLSPPESAVEYHIGHGFRQLASIRLHDAGEDENPSRILLSCQIR
jgi:hypothetical protein